MANIARLGVVLGLNTAEFQAGLKTAMQGLEKLEKALPRIGLAAAAAGTGLAVMIKKSINELDRLDEVSQMLGTTVESLSSLGKAAKIEGMNIEDLSGSMVKLTRTISEAASGSESAAYAFKSMGLDPTKFKNSEDALLQVADAFSNYEDGINKTALAVELFGKSGAQMIPFLNQGSAAILQIRTELDSFGNASTKAAVEAAEFNDRMTKLGIVANSLFQSFVSELLPVLNNFTQSLFDAYKESDVLQNEIKQLVTIDAVRWAENFAIGLGHVLDVAVFVVKAINALGQSVRVIGADIEFLAKSIDIFAGAGKKKKGFYQEWLDTKSERDRVLNEANAARAELADYNGAFISDAIKRSVEYARLQRLMPYDEFGTDDKPSKRPAPKPYQKPESDKNKNMLMEAQRIAAEFERERKHGLDMLRIKAEMDALTTNERRVQEAVNEVLDATSKKLEQIADKREAAAGRDASAEVLAEYDKQAEAVRKLGAEYAQLARIQEEQTIAAQQTFSYGWNQAFRQYAEDAENYATMAKDMFGALTGAMSQAIDNFVENGKFSFKDFAGSIIKDLIKIELKMQAMQLFRMGIGAITSAIGMYSGGGWGTGNAYGNQDMGGFLDSSALAGKANGGVINSPTLVGERGPELFIPGRSGTVIPNNNLGGMGGVTNITNNYIDAIDTKSFEDRIYGSSRAVWSANQFASKAISNNRSRT